MSVTASVSGIPSSTVVYSVNTGTSTAYISKPATANISSSQITFTAPTGVNDVVVVFRPIDFIAASVDVSKNVVITYNVNNPSGSGLIVSTIPCTSFAEAYYVLSDINTQLTSYYNQ